MFETNRDINNKEDDVQEELFLSVHSEPVFRKKLEDYINQKLDRLKFSFVLKHAVISLIALFLSFFLDLSTVPILGNTANQISKILFPSYEPINQSIEPISFWWLPVLAYGIFILFAFKTYNELKKAVKNAASPEVIDRIIGASVSVIDGISTALPLLGAAILLISIKMGPDVFLGLSVPFEIKALLVLAIGKLFEPVLDEMGVEFQNISSSVNELRNRHNLDLQLQSLKNNLNPANNFKNFELYTSSITNAIDDLKKFETHLKKTAEYSEQILNNLKQSGEIIKEITNTGIESEDKVKEVKDLTTKIYDTANSLKDEKTLMALKSLESIVHRNGIK